VGAAFFNQNSNYALCGGLSMIDLLEYFDSNKSFVLRYSFA
jgi:hypothetical protein